MLYKNITISIWSYSGFCQPHIGKNQLMQNKRIYSLSDMNQIISWPEEALDPVVQHGPGQALFLGSAVPWPLLLPGEVSLPAPDSPWAQENVLEWSQPKCWCCILSDQFGPVPIPEPVPVVRRMECTDWSPQVTWSPQMPGAGVSHIHSTLTNDRGTFPKKAN